MTKPMKCAPATTPDTGTDPADDDIQHAAVVSFDVGVFVRHTCPQDYHVDDTWTRFYLSEADTTAELTFDDRALLVLADTVARAATAMLLDRRRRRSVDPRPVAGPYELDSPHSAIRIDAAVSITGPCPMSFEIDSDGGHIVILDPDTLLLDFDERSLLEFARLTSQAARIVQDRTPQPASALDR
jgi:hypothetical protein